MDELDKASLTGLDSTESKMIDQSQRSSSAGHFWVPELFVPSATACNKRGMALALVCVRVVVSWFSSAADRRGFLRGGGGAENGWELDPIVELRLRDP